MRSHLTRHVFRQILASQPLMLHRPLLRQSRLRIPNQNGRVALNPVPARTFFNLFQKPKRDIRDPLLDPGMQKMLELDKRIHLIARLPPAKELLTAFQQFVQSKHKRDMVIQDAHAVHLLQTLETLEQYRVDENGPALSEEDLLMVQDVLLRKSEKVDVHYKLAKAVYTAIRARQTADADRDNARDFVALQNHVALLCAMNHTYEARDLLEVSLQASPSFEESRKAWQTVLRGFLRQGDEAAIKNTSERMKELSLTPLASREIRVEQAVHYAKTNDFKRFQHHFRPWMIQKSEMPVDGEFQAPDMLRILLEVCLKNDGMGWAQKTLEDKFHAFSDQESWGAILQAAAATGKGVDDIDRMITVLVRRAEEQAKGETRPDIDTFNNLIQFAIERKDPYKAERFFILAEKWDVEPDAQTFILQIEYRLMANDLEGAKSSYAELRDQDVHNDEDWHVMNRLAQALADADHDESKPLMSLIDDLSERRKLFTPETVRSLLIYHLLRDEYYEAVDLLQTYSPQFSTTVRLDLRDVLVSFTFDPNTDTGRAWDTYMIFHQVFDAETPRELRTRAMSLFFERRRPDLGTHVFTRMSTHMRANTRPDLDTYVAAFEGIAATGEPEALEVIHNLLKLDTDVEPCTLLHNSLMLAYTAVEREDLALDFWRTIVMSDEGPSYNSLFIAFKACQGQPYGDKVAKQIWHKIMQSDVEIGRELFHCYLEALTGQHLFDDAVELIADMEKIVGEGEKPDLTTMALFYNAGEGVSYQERIETWIKQNHPEHWTQMEAKGLQENEMGFKTVPGFERRFRA